VNGHPGQFLAEGYPTGGTSRNPQVVVGINTGPTRQDQRERLGSAVSSRATSTKALSAGDTWARLGK